MAHALGLSESIIKRVPEHSENTATHTLLTCPLSLLTPTQPECGISWKQKGCHCWGPWGWAMLQPFPGILVFYMFTPRVDSYTILFYYVITFSISLYTILSYIYN